MERRSPYGEGLIFGEWPTTASSRTRHRSISMATGLGRSMTAFAMGSAEAIPLETCANRASPLACSPIQIRTLSIGDAPTQKAGCCWEQDWIRIGLTGNLRDFQFVDSSGNTVTGADVIYGGQPTGYTATRLNPSTMRRYMTTRRCSTRSS